MLRIFSFLFFYFILTNHFTFIFCINSLLCDRDRDHMSDLIKDTIALDLDHYSVPGLRAFCTRRNEGDYSDLPLSVDVSLVNDAWIARLMYESTNKMYIERIKVENGSDDGSSTKEYIRYWILYRLTRTPYTCDTCRIGIYFTFNDTRLDGVYSLKYGFQLAIFKFFIDYSLPETIRREDKSGYSGVNKTFTPDQDNITVHLDDNFLGVASQNFLAGIGDQPDPPPTSPSDSGKKSKFFSFFAEMLPPFIRKRLIRPQRETSTEIFDMGKLLDIRIADGTQSVPANGHEHDLLLGEHNVVDMDRIQEARVPGEYSIRLQEQSEEQSNNSYEQFNDTQEQSEGQSNESAYKVSYKLGEEFLSLTNIPTVTIAYCYTYDSNLDPAKRVYFPSRLCYPFIDGDDSECICWTETQYKKFFMYVLTIVLAVGLLLLIIIKGKYPPKINRVDIQSRDENPSNLVKIKVTLGYLAHLSLPGFLDLDFKKADGSPLYHVRINRHIKWTRTKAMSDDVSELIINYKTNEPIVKPRYVEVTLFRNIPNEPLIYLYGVEYGIENIHTLNEIFIYGHYLDNRRTVRLSNAADWRRALTRIDLRTDLPIVTQTARSVTTIERLLLTLPIIYTLGPRIYTNINLKNLDTIFHGLPPAFSIEQTPILIGIAYIVLLKKGYQDSYHLIPLSVGHRVSGFFTILFIIVIANSYLTFLFQLTNAVWSGGKFNAEIARNYSDVQKMKDLAWIMALCVAILFSHLIFYIAEKITFKLSRPTKHGPASFDIGYDADQGQAEQPELPIPGLINPRIL